MKNSLILFKKVCVVVAVVVLTHGALNAQTVNIPDPNFKAALLDHYVVIDTNGDNEISVAEAEAFTGYLDIQNEGISDLTGLEAFVNITRLFIHDNNVSGILNLSANTKLERFGCAGNNIDSININKNVNLKRLNLTTNNLSYVDLSNNVELERVWLYENKIKSLDVTNNDKLQHLVVDNNELVSLDVSNNVKLLSLGVQFNSLKELDISNNNLLIVLNAWSNKFETVNVANGNNANMTMMKIYNNPNLKCIQHDEGFDPETIPCENGQGWCKDETANWSENCAVDVDELVFSESLELYPNPTQDIINVKLGNANFDNAVVYNSRGAKVMISNRETFSVEALEAGFYFIKVVTTEGDIQYKKFIKK